MKIQKGRLKAAPFFVCPQPFEWAARLAMRQFVFVILPFLPYGLGTFVATGSEGFAGASALAGMGEASTC